jgi:hypothetical protein
MRIAEDLLLLLTDDESGRLVTSAQHVDAALAGATVLELALAGRVALTGESDAGRPGRIRVVDPSSTGDEVLDHTLGILAAREGGKPASVLGPLGKDLRARLYERLAGRGLVHAQEGRVLGVIPTHRWPTADSSHEAEVRRGITLALQREEVTDPTVGALVSLLHALRCEHRVVDADALGLSRGELRRRAAAVATAGWASEAVHQAVEDLNAAVAAAVVVASSAGGAAG